MENIKHELNIVYNNDILSETHLFSCNISVSFTCAGCWTKLHPGFEAPPTITKRHGLMEDKSFTAFSFLQFHTECKSDWAYFHFKLILSWDCFRVSERLTVSIEIVRSTNYLSCALKWCFQCLYQLFFVSLSSPWVPLQTSARFCFPAIKE